MIEGSAMLWEKQKARRNATRVSRANEEEEMHVAMAAWSANCSGYA